MNNSKGLTMVEVLIVMVIAAVLAGIAVTVYGPYGEGSRITEAIPHCKQIIREQKIHSERHGFYIDLETTSNHFQYHTFPYGETFVIHVVAWNGDSFSYSKGEWIADSGNEVIVQSMLPHH